MILNNNISVVDPNAAYAIYIYRSGNVEVVNNNLYSHGNYLTLQFVLFLENVINNFRTVNYIYMKNVLTVKMMLKKSIYLMIYSDNEVLNVNFSKSL